MRRTLRWAGRGAVALGLLLVLASGCGYLFLLASLPQVEGTIEVAGLQAPVTVARDRWAIPRIAAESAEDAAFALGFVHAQDRLWQLEFQRRLGAGRLAEVLGGAALPADRFMRTLGLYRAAEASLAHLEPPTLAWLEAYAAGVNAHVTTRRGPLPPEFLILGHHEVEPWRPADSLVWLRMMALDLSTNWRAEVLRARLAQRLSREQIADLWPAYPEGAPVTLVSLARSLPFEALAAIAPDGAGGASNAWVVAGERSATGTPLLANDPHLGLKAPGTWYLAQVRSPEGEVTGATLPGVPGVVLGHNGSIAWGFTNTGSDVQDLFIEEVDPADPARYLTPDGTAPFAAREEVLEVVGGEPVTLQVRSTRHGPVLSDVVQDAPALFGGRVIALAWTALAEDDLTVQALMKLQRARGWPAFLEAVREVGAPQQNVHYADAAGHIGFVAPGRVPVRRSGDGRWPVPGWSGEYDWAGFIPFEHLPQAQDPPDGLLLNANNPVVPEDYPYLLTHDWEPPYRARRLGALLSAGRHDLASFARIQQDQRSGLADAVLPVMLEAEPGSEAARAAMAHLRAWDRVMRVEASEPLLFAAWYRELSRLIYQDELGDLFRAAWRLRPEFIERVLTVRQGWCDDVRTVAAETCPGLAARALELALADLERRFGRPWPEISWGEAHPAVMAHAPFGADPRLAWLFDIEVPHGGDGTTVDVGAYALDDPQRPFANVHGASFRGLYNLEDLGRSRFIAATGQSGHPLSPHYRDLARLWSEGRTVPLDGAGTRRRLRLQPGG